jgi:HAE1 family hydrophobic/amphiphilic exporter-1
MFNKFKKSKKSSASNQKKETYFQKFSLFFYDKKRFSLFAWLSLVLLGFLTYTTFIQRAGFPSVQVPISVVNANYFVDDKQLVDKSVALPISNSIQEIPEVKEVATTSNPNFMNALVTFDENITSQEGSKLVQEKLARLNLPERTTLTFQSIDASKFAFEYDMLAAVYSEKSKQLTPDQSSKATLLAQKISALSVVKEAKVVEQVRSSLDSASGIKKEVKTSFDFVGIKNSSGSIEFYESVNIGIKLKEGEDLLEASSSIQKTIDDFSVTSDFEGYSATLSSDFAPIVRTQISSLQKSMLEGFLIVALISFILVSWRTGLATALTMVTVLLTTVLILYLFGLTLNVISLFALILSLGLIVDDATIIAESIDSNRKYSKNRREVVKESIGRIARASTAGTLTTIFAFVPMLFISGILGGFIRAIPITIITSLALSLIVSLSLLPFLARGFLLPKSEKKVKLNPVQKGEKWIALKLATLIRYSGRDRKKGALITTFFILLSLVATMVGGTYFGKAGFDIFASEKDSNEILINASFVPASSIQESIKQSQTINQILQTESDNIESATYSGTGTDQSASISLLLTDLNEREDTSIQISERLQKQFDELKPKGITVSAASSGAGGASSDFPLEIRVLGDDVEKSNKLLGSIQQALQNEQFKTLSGKEFKVDKFLPSDPNRAIERIDSTRLTNIKVGFSIDSSTEVIEATRLFVEENFNPKDYALPKDSLQIDAGFEEDNQESFNSMLIAFPIMIVAMYLLLLIQFRSFLQPLFIFLAIPFSFLGVGMGLYFTNNAASFFVMLGFFALIGISVNNTILITDFANQERRKGIGRIDAIANALQLRFRPLLTTSITTVVALIPLAISDPFWQSLSVTLIFGVLSSTLLVILCFPYYLIVAEVFKSAGKKAKNKLRKSK